MEEASAQASEPLNSQKQRPFIHSNGLPVSGFVGQSGSARQAILFTSVALAVPLPGPGEAQDPGGPSLHSSTVHGSPSSMTVTAPVAELQHCVVRSQPAMHPRSHTPRGTLQVSVLQASLSLQSASSVHNPPTGCADGERTGLASFVPREAALSAVR